MGESQSRYGIMEELNNRKIKEKEKLANVERDTDNHVFEEEKKIIDVEQQIVTKEKNYKIEYADRQRQRKVNLDMVTGDYNRAKVELDEAMSDDKENYEVRFQDEKAQVEVIVKRTKEELSRYNVVQKKKIEEKKDIIKEIEEGISSLKEMSKEQKE